MNIEKFVACARLIHGERYNYDDVEYVNSRDHVTIQCPEHGEFKQSPSNHLFGSGCMKCAEHRATGDFITRAREIHGDRYDYSNVHYTCSREHVMISCPNHGVFQQLPNNHLRGSGCAMCVARGNCTRRLCTEHFQERARRTHGDRYDYSRVEYQNARSHVTITCPIHGEFNQIPSAHLRGCGCPRCGTSG